MNKITWRQLTNDVCVGRRYAVDMASIVVSITHWLQVGSPLFTGVIAGFQESAFMTSLKVKPPDLEPLLDNCTKVRVTTDWFSHLNRHRIEILNWKCNNFKGVVLLFRLWPGIHVHTPSQSRRKFGKVKFCYLLVELPIILNFSMNMLHWRTDFK